uniref:Transcription initiation factor TFIID component TAF4 C-terminal domain-containing protein n=1 Tax=Panagrolaimus sp. ES5 TaxID=591445 RepID=A0AC34GNC7_9BILA
MGDPRPMGGQSIPAPRFRVVPGPDDNRMSSYNNRPQRPNIRPNVDSNNQYMYQQDNNNFQRPNIPPRMQYQVRQGIPVQRMQQMNINQRMSPSMMMMPPPHSQQQQHQQRPQMQHQQQTQSELEASEQVNKEKLIRLFRSFCGLCNKTNKSNIPNLLILFERYISGKVDVTEFLQNITSFTNFTPQNNLPAFLENNIGLIRGDFESGKLSVDMFLPNRIAVTEASSSPQSMHASTASPQSHPGPSPGPRPTSSGPSPMQQKLLNEPPNSEPHPRMIVNYSPINQPPASAPSFDQGVRYATVTTSNISDITFQHRNSISETTTSNSPNMFAQPSSIGTTILPPPVTSMSSSSSFQSFQPPVVPEKRIKLELMETSAAVTTVIPSAENKIEQKPADLFPSTSTATEAVADVAFKEISSEQGDVEKCIFDRKAFAARLQRKMPECSAFEEQVLTMLSAFLETKIKSVLDRAYEAAEHRLEQLRVNPAFSQKDDPKMQLRVLEKQEKLEQQKRADVEKEAILKLSKGKGKDTDMLEKAKKIKKADEEAALNREANEAAIAALGSKKRKWQTPKDSGNPSTSQASSSRSRVKQVTMRDLMFVFERDQFAQNTLLYRKMLYGLIPSDNTKQP